MQDFNEFSKNDNGNQQNLMDMVTKLSKKFDGKSQDELYKAIFAEAEKGKRAGTLTNNDIDNFVACLTPFLDGKKLKYLNRIAEKLKEI